MGNLVWLLVPVMAVPFIGMERHVLRGALVW